MGRLGSRAIKKKRVWADYEQLFSVVFSCFQGQKRIFKFFKKHCSFGTKKLHKMKLYIVFFLIFLTPKTEKTLFWGLILRFLNLNVLHKGLLMQDWVFRLGIYSSHSVANVN